MKWVKNDHGNTIAEIVEYNTGISTKEFLNPKTRPLPGKLRRCSTIYTERNRCWIQDICNRRLRL